MFFFVEFICELCGSDFLYWGEGKVFVIVESIVYEGKMVSGLDYKFYFIKDFVEYEDEFNLIKFEVFLIGDIKSFGGFFVDVLEGVNVSDYIIVVVWCESFGEFIIFVKY